jgi:mannitol 2-dehydrogenase
VIAAWCFYSDRGAGRDGRPLEIVDGMKAELHQAAAATCTDKLSFLKLQPVFGDLVRNRTFTKVYVRMIDALYENPDISRQMQAILSAGK